MAHSKKNIELLPTLTVAEAAGGRVKDDSQNVDAFPQRMKTLVERVGSMAEIARKCGIPESTVKKWVDGISDPSRERCVALARGTNTSVLWLVTGEGPMDAVAAQALVPPSQPLRPEGLTISIQLAAEALEGKYLPPPKYAELVSLIYELLEEGLPEAKILRFARVAGPGE